MPETAFHPKLCKFRPSDMICIKAIMEHYGFEDEITAIRFALKQGMLGLPSEKKVKNSKKGG
jgi:hypothetical protein